MNHFRLESPRLILRNYQFEDWEAVHLYASVPEFSQYEIWGPNSIDDTKIFVNQMITQAASKDRFLFNLALCLKDGTFVGGCGIRRESQGSHIANLGWAISPAFQNQGYATEAARRLIDYGFQDLKLKVICATCDARNLASAKVMEKIGMTRVGLLKGEKIQKGFLRDTLRYEILSS